jgi:hypothetical protein
MLVFLLLCCGTILCALFSDILSFTFRPAKGNKSFLNVIKERQLSQQRENCSYWYFEHCHWVTEVMERIVNMSALPMWFEIWTEPGCLYHTTYIYEHHNLTEWLVCFRHLLSDQTDPFNRSPLTMDMVKPNDELRMLIQAWIKERKLQHQTQTHSSHIWKLC